MELCRCSQASDAQEPQFQGTQSMLPHLLLPEPETVRFRRLIPVNAIRSSKLLFVPSPYFPKEDTIEGSPPGMPNKVQILLFAASLALIIVWFRFSRGPPARSIAVARRGPNGLKTRKRNHSHGSEMDTSRIK